jgi:hypothetical protein
MLYISDFPLKAWLQSHPELLEDIKEHHFMEKFLKRDFITLTYWGNFSKNPKFNWNEKIICMLRGQETFRLVSFIYKLEFYSGVKRSLNPQDIPINLFNEDMNKEDKKLIYEVVINHGDCLYLPSLHWFQSKTTSGNVQDYYP